MLLYMLNCSERERTATMDRAIGEEVFYVPASGDRWCYLLSESADGLWYWEYPRTRATASDTALHGPFVSRGEAVFAAETDIDTLAPAPAMSR
jgi:hypothetical protein